MDRRLLHPGSEGSKKCKPPARSRLRRLPRLALALPDYKGNRCLSDSCSAQTRYALYVGKLAVALVDPPKSNATSCTRSMNIRMYQKCVRHQMYQTSEELWHLRKAPTNDVTRAG